MSMVKLLFLVSMMHAQPVNVPAQVEVPPVQQSGWATWYGNGDWHGSITATGETFKPLDHTCASRTIPLNTVVLVERVSTGRMVWCRVNDRGPYGARQEDGSWAVKLTSSDPGRWRGIMDLSLGTSRALAETEGRPPNMDIRIRYWARPQRRFVAFR